MICPNCNNEFNEWFSRDKGKPQKFPYKTCFSCKQAKVIQAEEESLHGNRDNGKANAALEMIYELQGIRAILERIELGLGKQEIGKPF